MKKLFAFFALVILAINSIGQTAASVTDGNWYNPVTWDCLCIPTGGYDVTVNHNVVLDNDYALTGGSITIGATGIVRENSLSRYFLLTSGSFVNNGKFEVSHVALNGGMFLNNDSCVINNQFYCGAPVINTGVIGDVDSLLIMDKFINNTGAVVNANMLSVTDTLFNDGTLNVTYLSNFDNFVNNNDANFVNFFNAAAGKNSGNISFHDFANSGIYLNYGIMTGVADATNIGYLYIDTIGQLLVHNDFSNVDTTNHEAYIFLEGLLHVGNNFYNRDTIFGEKGNICVVHTSANYGTMQGNFDFCGLNSAGGHVDLNNGYISPAITYCTKSCAASAPSVQEKMVSLSVYPNPSNSVFNFEFDSQVENALFILTDITGRKLISESGINGTKFIIDGRNFPSGIYIYSFEASEKNYRGKLIIK
jgi:hypothetical protein